MIKTACINYLACIFYLLLTVNSYAQELLDIGEKSASESLLSTALRSKTAISIGVGSTLLNGDFKTSDYENFLEFQLKQSVTSKLIISGNLKKFDVKNYDFDKYGFLSGDLNLEWYMLPNNKLTPYLYAGPGLLISNDFDDKNYKVQGGIGLDYLINNWLGIVASIEANYIYDEQNGSQLLQKADGLYYNANIGLQFYFGNGTYATRGSKRKKRRKKEKTIKEKSSIIESNWIGKT
ncbi:hypothetical protein [Psychroserpens damuponensis]|uniref:hypothetical protein n=1 Tax=Psychroserpens damuponensis TaxID=943936 RepID=UPI0005912B90|nr:hypothetical protein [Psychroserpens damuponensis]